MTDIKVVIGANIGDEGKGLMADYFCHQATQENKKCLNILSNGGSQRGHTVTTPSGISHVFHHFGSGTFANARTYFPKYFILNPMNFVREWNELNELGCNPVSYCSLLCKWSTPYDMLVNQIVETYRGDKRHGSCGIGIWETEYRYSVKPMLHDIYSFNNLTIEQKVDILEELRDGYYIDRLKQLGVNKISNEYREIFYSKDLIYHFLADMNFMCCNMIPVWNEKFLNEYFDTVVFENGQGLLLDQSLESFYGDNLTPSNTGSTNAYNIISNVFPKANVELCYVSRTYMTRHGAGRFVTECDKSNINKDMIDQHNVTNEFQGSLRYGELIVPQLISRVSNDAQKFKDAKVSIAMTHTNEFNNIDYDKLSRFNVYTSDDRTRDSIKSMNL